MTLNLISPNAFPTYIALSTDIINNKLPGAGIIGGTVYLEDTLTWKIISGNMLTLVDFKLPANYTALPSAASQAVTTNEDTPKPITLAGAKADTLSLTYAIITPPQNGVVTGTLPTATYTPNEDFNGDDEFTFVVNDGLSNSLPATVSVTITPVNDAPIAVAQTVQTNEDIPLNIVLVANDIDADVLTYAVVVPPANGTLTGTAPNLIYTPSTHYNGADSFTFKANDGTIDSNVAAVGITVNAVNDTPVVDAQSVLTDEDVPLPITLTGNDIDSDPLTFIIVSEPLHGELTGLTPVFTYTPDANYNGADSFTFKGNDGTIDSLPKTIGITIGAIQDAPVANSQTVETNEDTPLSVTLTGSDVDNETLTFVVVDLPLHGILTGTVPNLTYTPTANYAGADSFTFTANDGTVASIPAVISITVNPINDAPVANNQTISLIPNGSAQFILDYSDVENETLTYNLSVAPLHGDLTGTAPNLTYTADTNYHGTDSFEYSVADPNLGTDSATVTVLVNTAPVATSQPSVTAVQGVGQAITLTGSDVDSDTLTYTVVAAPIHGVITGTVPSLTYTADVAYVGADSFTFKVNDGFMDSTVGTIDILVGTP